VTLTESIGDLSRQNWNNCDAIGSKINSRLARFSAMPGAFCSVRITQDVREYAEKHGVVDEKSRAVGMSEKAMEFVATERWWRPALVRNGVICEEGSMFKLIFALGMVLGFFLLEVTAQACGYSYAKFFLTDATGSAVRSASFDFLDKDSNDIVIHSSKALKWSEKEGNYFLSEGMCSGHHDVRVKINASGFEPIERIIDLPLTNVKHPLVYRVRLKKNNSDQVSSFEYVSQLKGNIFDANGSVVPGAKVSARDVNGRIFSTVSGEVGEYTLELSYNRYDRSFGFREAKYAITVQKEGFQMASLDYVFIPSQFGAMNLDIGLAILTSSHPVKASNK
jgi:hypothetical protein